MADVNYWDNAAFGTTSPAETAEKPLSMWDKLFGGAINSLATLPKRAIDASTQDVQHLGEPDYQRQSIGPAVDTAMTMTGGAGIVPAEANSLRMGIKAYHGSPHDFDRFSMDKIGTGEGAQAYGHGLYFAEAEPTAKAYRDQLSRSKKQPFTPEELTDSIANSIGSKDPSAVFVELQKRQSEGLGTTYGGMYKDALPRLSSLEGVQAAMKPPGHMYEVNINADPAHFLDWDKPLTGQSDVAQRILQIPQVAKQQASQTSFLGPDKGLTGRSAYAAASGWKRGAELSPSNPAATTDMLREAGIPGIKYLDQGSRGAGQGSSNFVVFNDKLIDIIKKYGLAGIAPPAAAMSYDNLMRNNQ